MTALVRRLRRLLAGQQLDLVHHRQGHANLRSASTTTAAPTTARPQSRPAATVNGGGRGGNRRPDRRLRQHRQQTGSGATAPVAAGSYQVTASFAGSADYLPASNSTTFTIGKATPTISVSDNGGTYDGATAFAAAATVNGGAALETVGLTVDYVNTASKQDLGATAPVAAGSYVVTASFAGSADYLPASNSTSFIIGKATPTVSVSDNGGTYDGAPAFAAAATVNGGAALETVGMTLDYVNTVSNQDLGATAPVVAGSYVVTASSSPAPPTTCRPASRPCSPSARPRQRSASATTAGTYDGSTAFAATASVNGKRRGWNKRRSDPRLRQHRQQPGPRRHRSCCGRQLRGDRGLRRLRRLPAGQQLDFVHRRQGHANGQRQLGDNGGTLQDGNATAFAATATVNGDATLEAVGLTLDYVNTVSNQDLSATAPVAAGSYIVTASFAGSADYLPASNSTTFTVGKATPTVSVSDNGGTYDGARHGLRGHGHGQRHRRHAGSRRPDARLRQHRQQPGPERDRSRRGRQLQGDRVLRRLCRLPAGQQLHFVHRRRRPRRRSASATTAAPTTAPRPSRPPPA